MRSCWIYHRIGPGCQRVLLPLLVRAADLQAGGGRSDRIAVGMARDRIADLTIDLDFDIGRAVNKRELLDDCFLAVANGSSLAHRPCLSGRLLAAALLAFIAPRQTGKAMGLTVGGGLVRGFLSLFFLRLWQKLYPAAAGHFAGNGFVGWRPDVAGLRRVR